jgi:hypothetical protein
MSKYRIHLRGTFNPLIASMLTTSIIALVAKGMSREEAIIEVTEIWIFMTSKLEKTSPDNILDIVTEKLDE